jgi:hypothetical protein
MAAIQPSSLSVLPVDSAGRTRHNARMARPLRWQNHLAVFSALLVAGLLLAAASPARAQTLYDASLGTLPQSQGWLFGALGIYSDTLVNDSVLLDTTTITSTQAGWGDYSPPDLNRSNGFTLLFTAMLNAETHTSTNRAGFSIIVLCDDTNGIELGFWTNAVFAQSDSPLFTQAESTTFLTAGSFINYALIMLPTNYILLANGTPILSGPVRNYTAFNGSPNPYRTPNFIFFGDDTGSASALVNVRQLTLILPPQLTMSAPGIISWAGVSNQTYEVQASMNLTTWTNVGAATSQNSSFGFTNNASQSSQFFRIAFP